MTECTHEHRSDEGLCPDCGDCTHEIVLNGACYACGTTDVKPKPKPRSELIPPDRLRKR